MRTIAIVSVLAVAVSISLGLVGCGQNDDSTGATTGAARSAGAVTPGGGLSVREALASDAEPPLAVAGWVVGSGDDARLCSAYDASADEPCVEPSLSLEGDVTAASNERVTLFGAVDGDTFVVSSTLQG